MVASFIQIGYHLSKYIDSLPHIVKQNCLTKSEIFHYLSTNLDLRSIIYGMMLLRHVGQKNHNYFD